MDAETRLIAMAVTGWVIIAGIALGLIIVNRGRSVK